MATILGDICAPTGKYIKDGEEKTSWSKCGVLMQTEKGYRIKLDTVPLGGEGQGIWFSVFEKRDDQRQGSGTQTPSRPSGGQPEEGEMPF